MLREIQSGNGKNVPANYKATVAMETGMGVVIDMVNKEAKFPTAATADNIYIVDKARVPSGLNAARGDMSDYDDDFIKVASGDFVKLQTYTNPEVFGTDQKGATATKGKVLMVGTDGKWIDATSSVTSKYLYVEDVNDNGHVLMKIAVLDTPIKNA